MSDNFFDKMTKDFKDVAEYREFAEAQHETIIELGKKIKDLENKLKSAPKEVTKIQSVISPDSRMSNEEIICVTQLQMLKVVSNERELTLEEAKRVDIFSRILNQIQNKKKDTEEDPLKDVSAEELLRIVENGTH